MTVHSPVPLTPRMSDLVGDLTSESTLIASLVDALGSPLNLILPQQIRRNVDEFARTMAVHGLEGSVYYAHKANRSSALVRELADTDARIDVASLAELQHALGSGFAPDRIMTTGPKTPEFLWLALRSGVTINVDTVQELTLVGEISCAHDLPRVDVLVRLSSFTSSGTTISSRPSRFGVSTDGVDAVFSVLDKFRDQLRLLGFAYHLDTIGIPEKARAFDGCLLAMEEARARGHDPRVVDIGGGFGVDYVADAGEWDAFTTALSEAVLGRRDPITWQSTGYGLRNEGGRLRGTLGLYPAHRPVSGPRYLDSLLSTDAPNVGSTLAEAVLDNMHRLWIEPGRSLLDQCGVVVGRVLEVRPANEDESFVRLDLNARDISIEEHGVHLDPVLVPARIGERRPGAGYLIGNLCLEADFITRRKIWFDAMPEPGDLLAFVNTAGYFMDFSADHALDQPIARVVALSRNESGWSWRLDDQYWPDPFYRSAPCSSISSQEGS
ncbi:Y4yA family PLP-dependent enzyme [Rhodococcus sp. NPDC058521]|uniref:Y4yA family PLP-dependent enzyme n=1 Tax=Rhodococcus sp. NPDC058521 TaxID=3346536 RepID=UPI0036635377